MSNLKNIFGFFKTNENDGDTKNDQANTNGQDNQNEQDQISKDISSLQQLFNTTRNNEPVEKDQNIQKEKQNKIKKSKKKEKINEKNQEQEKDITKPNLEQNENSDFSDEEIKDIGNIDIETVSAIFKINNKSQSDTKKIILELKSALNITEKPNEVKIINGINQDEINVLDNWYISNKMKIIPCLFEDKPLNSGLLNSLYAIDPSFKNKKIKIIRYLKYTKKVYEQVLKKCSEINKEERKEICKNTILNILHNDIQNINDKKYMEQIIILINKEKNYINLKFYFQFLLSLSINFYDLFVELNGLSSLKNILQNIAKKNIIKKCIPLIIQIFNLLKKLNMTLDLLKSTLIGIPINLIAKNKQDIKNNLNYITDNPQVQNIAQEIVDKWRSIRDQSIKEIQKEENNQVKKVHDINSTEARNENGLKQSANNYTTANLLQYDREINSDAKKSKTAQSNEGKNIMLEIIDTINEEYEKKKKRHLEYKKAKIEGKIKKFSAMKNTTEENKSTDLLNDIINIQKEVELEQALKQKDKRLSSLYPGGNKFGPNKNSINNRNLVNYKNEKYINNPMDANPNYINKNRERYPDNHPHSNKYNKYETNFKNRPMENQNYLKHKKGFSDSPHRYNEYNDNEMYEQEYMSNKNYNDRHNKFQNKRKSKQYDNYPNKFSNYPNITNKHSDELKKISSLFSNNNNNAKEELDDSLSVIFKNYNKFEKIKERHHQHISSIYYPPRILDDTEISKTDLIIKFNYNKQNKLSIYLKYNNDSNNITNNFNVLQMPELFPTPDLNLLKLPPIPIISNFTQSQNISSNIFPYDNQTIQSSLSDGNNRNLTNSSIKNKIYNNFDEFINIFDDNIKQILLKNMDLANLLMSKPDVVNKMLKGPQYINEALCSLEEELKSWGKPNPIS
ncbi:conserved Plasmodium protein, unknown function [Plasmodium vinckei vinckei]|uniref:TFIIS N-terminal domain-containing protein n=1 Tax=Plasmodium vinckei vinckei TaxID=54757 RepID=A0A081IBE2_PLAVN|nr:conserved Plasmodium protein, unknown function [Plasmodium vinckei vinckei]KEG01000.1 hypothetical protein YYE_04033 [Plasmodium vinckei vinckei]VEV55069.1 conserved Plasmodium protein, unknown function [Plasmodium vinckei vinckei]